MACADESTIRTWTGLASCSPTNPRCPSPSMTSIEAAALAGGAFGVSDAAHATMASAAVITARPSRRRTVGPRLRRFTRDAMRLVPRLRTPRVTRNRRDQLVELLRLREHIRCHAHAV